MNLIEFRDQFVSSFDEHRERNISIGIEGEFIAVHGDKSNDKTYGRAIDNRDVKRLFSALVDNNIGWRYGANSYELLMENRNKSGYEVSLSTDFGTGTLEIGFDPSYTIHDSEIKVRGILRPFVRIAEENGIYILGTGTSPISKAGFDLMAPKTRYHALKANLHKGVAKQSITAAGQVHLGLPTDIIVESHNMFNGIAPVLIALASNGSVTGGKVNGLAEFRVNGCWDHVRFTGQRRLPNSSRVGIAPHIEWLGDYFDIMSAYDVILTKREEHEEYLMFQRGKNLRDFVTEGEAEVVKLDGHSNDKRIKIRPTQEDVRMLGGTVWWESRANFHYGTNEIRSMSQQPDVESMIALAALCRGLVGNLSEASELANKYTIYELKDARQDAGRNGLMGRVGKDPIIEVARDILSIASKGLEASDQGSHWLAPLYERVETGKSPADIAREVFRKDGIKGYIEKARLKVARLKV